MWNLICFSVRVGLHWFVTKPLFDGFILFVIMMSSVALAAEDPVQENHPRNKLLKFFDYGFTGIFAIECILKVGQFLRNSKVNVEGSLSETTGLVRGFESWGLGNK